MLKAASQPTRAKIDPYVALGVLAVFAFFLMSGAIAYNNIRNLAADTEEVGHTHDVLNALEHLVSDLKDAETGQRGYPAHRQGRISGAVYARHDAGRLGRGCG